MKKCLWMNLLVGFSFVFFFSFAASAKTITLSFTQQNPENAWGSINAMQPWIQKVEKAAEGTIKIRGYYSQTLNKGPDTWNAVRDGIADIGWCFHAYWPGMTSLSDVISLPSLPFSTAEEGREG